MKKTFQYISILFLLLSCNKSPLTCSFSGQKIEKTITLSHFDQIEVNPGIHLVVLDTNRTEIKIVADKDVMNNVEYEIVNDKLILNNHTDCLVQNLDAEAWIYVQTDNLHQIVANTDLDVKSGNVWHFDNISLICENVSIGNNNIADFDIDFQGNRMSVVANGSSIFKIRGQAQDLFVGFYGVNPMFMGQDFQVQHIDVYHRCSGDMHLFPIDSVTGDLYGYGDIYLHHQPPTINIREHYAGHIYFVN